MIKVNLFNNDGRIIDYTCERFLEKEFMETRGNDLLKNLAFDCSLGRKTFTELVKDFQDNAYKMFKNPFNDSWSKPYTEDNFKKVVNTYINEKFKEYEMDIINSCDSKNFLEKFDKFNTKVKYKIKNFDSSLDFLKEQPIINDIFKLCDACSNSGITEFSSIPIKDNNSAKAFKSFSESYKYNVADATLTISMGAILDNIELNYLYNYPDNSIWKNVWFTIKIYRNANSTSDEFEIKIEGTKGLKEISYNYYMKDIKFRILENLRDYFAFLKNKVLKAMKEIGSALQVEVI